ncbi:hypothetical protein Mapa_013718 [Marchantia paleacea]|nr:hypothetical protein Mapa_013718 [Marchantia paleacea]
MLSALTLILAIFNWNKVVVNADENHAALRSLGRIVYLPEVTLESDHTSDPMIFDADNLSSIAKTSVSPYTDTSSKWYENSESFTRSIGAQMGISGSYNALSFSVDSEFKRVSGQESNVKVAEVRAMSFYSRTYVERGVDLFNFPLKSEFLNDFRSLPTLLDSPEYDLAWAPFRDFMRKWGSHIVYVAYTGAAFQSWSSARSERNYEQWQMEAKACVKAEGIKGAALQACAGYSESQRQQSITLTTSDTRRVKGGTVSTRTQLATSLATPDLLQKFLSENNQDGQPVRYLYLPVWNFILGRGGQTDDARRARGLQAYYEGWKAHTCPLVVTEGQSNNKAQMFVAEYNQKSESTGYYLCIRRCNGCHAYDDDCHYDAGAMCCRSYGPSVLKRSSGDFVTRATDWYSGWCDWDNGCLYQAGYGCICSKSNEEEGCNYEYPLNSPGSYWLKYKVIWNQHSLTTAISDIDLPMGQIEVSSEGRGILHNGTDHVQHMSMDK